MLKLKQISKSYKTTTGQLTVLSNVDLDIAAGEVVAVRGPSGCGKTTLLLIAGGLLQPDSGNVAVDDSSLYDQSQSKRAHTRSAMFGYVYQQFHLMPYLNVLDNVLVPTLVTGTDLRDRALQLLDALKLSDRLHHKPAALSIGERQRTALARALIASPKILLADEPTGNLDDVNADIVLQHLIQFAENGGAVLVVTHDRAIAEKASRRLVLADGTLSPQ